MAVAQTKGQKVERGERGNGSALASRVLTGGIWVLASRVTLQAATFMKLGVLAHFLVPKDFGTIGVVLLTMDILDTFSRVGLQQALIHQSADIEEHLSPIWTLLFFRGAALSAALFLGAPLAAAALRTPDVQPLMQAASLCFLFQGATHIGVVCLQKELKFRKHTAYEVTGIVTDFAVSLVAAFTLRNAWALLIGRIAGDGAKCLASHLLCPQRLKVDVEWGRIRELFWFSRWIHGSNILAFALTHGDDLLVAKLLGTPALGVYQMAYKISNAPATEISHVIAKVAFPGYSMIQGNLPRLREAYMKVLDVTALFSFLLTGLMLGMSQDLVLVMLGDKWHEVIRPMQILLIGGLVRSIGGTIGAVLQGSGRPDLVTKSMVASLVIAVSMIYPLTMRWGIVGTSLAVVVPGLIVNAFLVQKLAKILNSSSAKLLRVLVLQALSAAAMTSGIVYLARFNTMPKIIGILALTFGGTAVYFAITFMLNKRIFERVKTIGRGLERTFNYGDRRCEYA